MVPCPFSERCAWHENYAGATFADAQPPRYFRTQSSANKDEQTVPHFSGPFTKPSHVLWSLCEAVPHQDDEICGDDEEQLEECEMQASPPMVIELALELRCRAEAFEVAGDTRRSQRLLQQSLEELRNARAAMPPAGASKLSISLDEVLRSWQQKEEEEAHATTAAHLGKLLEDSRLARALSAGTPEDFDKKKSATVAVQESALPGPEKQSPLLAPIAVQVEMDPILVAPSLPAARKIAESANSNVVASATESDLAPLADVFELEQCTAPESMSLISRDTVKKRVSPLSKICACFRSRGAEELKPRRAKRLCLDQDFARGNVIGTGSQGCVFNARHTKTGRIVAVKEICLDRVSGDRGTASERLARELRLCEQLRHPRIVRYVGHEFVIGAQRGPERVYLFLEYCSSGSLQSHLNIYGKLGALLIAKYVGHLVEGLCYLHSRNPPVVHRDLKCANLLLALDAGEGALCLKITDFGCSKVMHQGDSMAEHSVVGSVFWMAPECMRGKNKLTKSVDIWSTGCCLVEMATAKPPWAEKNFENILIAFSVIAMSNEMPVLPDELPTQAADFARACLRRNPSERPAAQELQGHPLLTGRVT